MTYELVEVDGGTRVSFTHQDPREMDTADEGSDDENPVLGALRTVAEALTNS